MDQEKIMTMSRQMGKTNTVKFMIEAAEVLNNLEVPKENRWYFDRKKQQWVKVGHWEK